MPPRKGGKKAKKATSGREREEGKNNRQYKK